MKIYALIFILAMTSTSHAQEPSKTPLVTAQFSNDGNTFDQKIKVVFTPALELEKIRQYSENANLMKALSDFVNDNEYKMVGQDQQFWLTIGKATAKYTHMFHCQESMNEMQWALTCNQDPTEPKGEKILSGGAKNMQCTNTKPEGAPTTTTCLYEMKGQATDLDILFFHFSSRHISYVLFSEMVNYVTGLAYLASGMPGDASNVKKEVMGSPAFAAFLKLIDQTTKQVKSSDLKKPIDLEFSSQDARTASLVDFNLDLPTIFNQLNAAAIFDDQNDNW